MTKPYLQTDFSKGVHIGVVGVQGDVSEHIGAIEEALRASGRKGKVTLLRRVDDLAKINAVTIPGGESTTISRLLVESKLFGRLQQMGEEGVPILGTCAGCILLSKNAGVQAEKSNTKLLGLMDMEVERNAFGRQRESFEADLIITGLEGSFKGVFIRAPAIKRVWGNCEVLSRLGDVIVMVKQGDLMGAVFHPELAGDTRLHEMFLGLI